MYNCLSPAAGPVKCLQRVRRELGGAQPRYIYIYIYTHTYIYIYIYYTPRSRIHDDGYI